MNKKILSIMLVCVLAIGAVVGGTLAYFTDNETQDNVYKYGSIDIEFTSDPETVTHILPGHSYVFSPVVENIGENDAWIRFDVTLSDAKAFTTAAAKYGITDLSTIFNKGDNFDDNWVLAGKPVYDETADTLTYSYYHVKRLITSETPRNLTTEEFCKGFTIPYQFNNADMASVDEFTITVQAHAMQHLNEEFETVQDAFAAYIFEPKS